jgi:cytochrome c553
LVGRAGKAGAAALALIAGALPAAAATPPEKLEVCLACHGAEGQSETDNVPSLGAQPSKYALIQVFMFRERLRAVEPMSELMKGWTDADLQATADFIAALPAPKPPAEPADPARMERARALVEQNHCNVCHQADFSGQENVPRLADQREDYLLKALRDYKSGERRGYDATMAEVLQPLGDAQFVELAYYLAHFGQAAGVR